MITIVYPEDLLYATPDLAEYLSLDIRLYGLLNERVGLDPNRYKKIPEKFRVKITADGLPREYDRYYGDGNSRYCYDSKCEGGLLYYQIAKNEWVGVKTDEIGKDDLPEWLYQQIEDAFVAAYWAHEEQVKRSIQEEKERFEQYKKEAVAAKELANMFELPELSGTEKQTVWAEQIRANAMKTMEGKEFQKIAKRRTAKWWIENRKKVGWGKK